MNIPIIVIFLGFVALFTTGAWRTHGKISSRDRWSLVTSFASAITAFGIAWMLLAWTVVPFALWLISTGLLAGGVVGAVLRWPELAWFGGTRPGRYAAGAIATQCTCVLILGLAVI